MDESRVSSTPEAATDAAVGSNSTATATATAVSVGLFKPPNESDAGWPRDANPESEVGSGAWSNAPTGVAKGSSVGESGSTNGPEPENTSSPGNRLSQIKQINECKGSTRFGAFSHMWSNSWNSGGAENIRSVAKGIGRLHLSRSNHNNLKQVATDCSQICAEA